MFDKWSFWRKTHKHDGKDSALIDVSVTTDSTLTGTGTQADPLGVVSSTRSGVFARIPSSSTQNVSTGTFTKVIYGTEDHDTLSEYDPSTGIFTASGDGFRQISSIIAWSGDDSSPAGIRIASIYLNGVRLDKGREVLVFADHSISGWYGRINISQGFYLEDGDTIAIYVYQSSGNTLQVQGSSLSIVAVG